MVEQAPARTATVPGSTEIVFPYVEGAGMHPHPMPFYIAAMGIILKEGTI